MNAKSREIIKTGVVRNPGVMSKMDRENIIFYMKVQLYRSANGFFENILAILCFLRDSQRDKVVTCDEASLDSYVGKFDPNGWRKVLKPN